MRISSAGTPAVKRWVPLLIMAIVLAGSPANAFRFSIWRSGITVAQALDLAERNDLPLVAEGLYSGNPHFDPAASRAKQDTAAAFSYRAEIRSRPATVTLSFHPTTRRLHPITVRWGGALRESAFAQERTLGTGPGAAGGGP
ncbi:MAG: hypothetical protein HY900_23290 [Deltaproteobacteria bacterium]|nr:hypothetical protein [Deltaproteobacteria bacterium]